MTRAERNEARRRREEAGVTQIVAASMLGMTAATLRLWRAQGCPSWKKGNKILVDPDEVRAWGAARGLEPGRSGRPSKLKLAQAAEKRAGTAPETGEKARILDEKPPKPTDSADTLIRKEALAKARAQFWKAKTDKLKALREEGRLVSREEAIAAHTHAVERAKAAFLSMPSKVAATLAAETNARKIEERLDAAVREILRELSR